MYPHTHFLVAFLIGEIFVSLGLITHIHALLCGIIAFLIDIDHYFSHGVKTKDWNFRNAWNSTVVKRDIVERMHAHHKSGILYLVMIGVSIFLQDIGLMSIFFVGYFSHLLLDYMGLNIAKRHHIKRYRLGKYLMKISHYEWLVGLFALIGLSMNFIIKI